LPTSPSDAAAAAAGVSAAKPEVIFLDVGDTMIRAHPSWAAVYRAGLAEMGIEVDERDMERALLDETRAGAWWTIEETWEPSEQASYELIKRFDAAVLRRLGHDELTDEVFRAIEAAFARRSAWYVFPDVVPAVEAMRRTGLRLCVISNFVWGGPELIHDLELARHFEALVISARIGFQKPNAGIFRHALGVMKVSPDRALHVGDSYRADVGGARRVGIRAVLIDRSGADPARLRDEHDDPDLAVIHDLLGLLDLLGVARPVAAGSA
jgi:putative hydrolase of the HAD superfamily